MQYIAYDLQECAEVMASCDRLEVSYTVQKGFIESKKIGFFTRREKHDYTPCYVIQTQEEENNDDSQGRLNEGEDGNTANDS